MTGPENFKEATRLLADAKYEKNEVERARMLSTAQVHATLALVAATVYSSNMTKDEQTPWRTYGVRV